MIKQWILFGMLFLFCFSKATGQVVIGKSKSAAKDALSTGFRKYNKNSVTAETDSSYTYYLKGVARPLEVHLLFDRNGKCRYERWHFDCDSCYHTILSYILNKKRLKWKQKAAGEYISAPSQQLLLEEQPADHSFTITKSLVPLSAYKVLYEKSGS